jgi:hypothetical protein
MLGNYRVASQLVASRVVFSYIELVLKLSSIDSVGFRPTNLPCSMGNQWLMC